MDLNSTFIATVGGGFFTGVLIGYALKKVIKLVSIIVGLFFAGLAYLQYQQIASINWGKLHSVSEGAVTMLANATTQIPMGVSNGSNSNGSNSNGSGEIVTAAMTNFGIPLTGSMAMGFAFGFMRG
jgi:uncharacterized membrane protein (Fun14 family)